MYSKLIIDYLILFTIRVFFLFYYRASIWTTSATASSKGGAHRQQPASIMNEMVFFSFWQCMLKKSVLKFQNVYIIQCFMFAAIQAKPIIYHKHHRVSWHHTLSKICDFSVNLIVILKHKETFQGLIYCAENRVLDICQLDLNMIYMITKLRRYHLRLHFFSLITFIL